MTQSNSLTDLWLKDFKKLEVPHLIVNIWRSNTNQEHLKECSICNLRSKYSIMTLREKWEEEWGDFEYFVEKLKQNNKQFINVPNYSNENKHQMIDVIKTFNKKK